MLSNLFNQPNISIGIKVKIFNNPFLDEVMSKNFHLKKNDHEKINGAAKHRFNAEYSDELEFNSKKGKKTSPRRAIERLRGFTELH